MDVMTNVKKLSQAQYAVLFYPAIGSLLGFCFGVSDNPALLSLSVLFPVAWILAKSRSEAFILAFCYYLTASRGVPKGSATFFGESGLSLFLGVFFWLSSAFCLSLPWALFKRKRNDCIKEILALIAVYILITLPPLGLFGWASPLLSAGILFPKSGFLGIIAVIILPPILASFLASGKLVAASAFITYILMVSFAPSGWTPPASPCGFAAINTNYARLASGSAVFTDAFIRSTNLIQRVLACEEKYVLLPETVAGAWTKASRSLWLPIGDYLAKEGQTLIVGAEIYDEELKYDNCMIFLGTDDVNIYRQRVPVPFSMWRPFGGKGTANAHWFGDGTVKLADGRTALCLICYEQYLTFPVLWTMFTAKSRPQMIIATANQWWSKKTSIPNIQRQCAASWASLFDLDLAEAVNR